MMNLYYVTNGIEGVSQVHCLVLAESLARSWELAREKFKKENPEFPDYYNNLQSKLIFRDCSKEQVSELSDQ